MNDWISINDMLPEKDACVLTAGKDGRIFMSSWTGNRFKLVYAVWDHDNVTHWMALPEPPKVLK